MRPESQDLRLYDDLKPPAVRDPRVDPDEGPLPVVLPGQEGMPVERRSRLQVALWVGGVAVALIAGFFFLRGGNGHGAARAGLEFGGGSGGTALAAVPDSSAPAPTGAAIAFDSGLDSLLASVHRFRVRDRDFRSHRIGCEELARGYRAVDGDFVTLSERFREARDRLDSTRVTRYRDAADRVDSVESAYADTRCPRPR